MSIEHRTYTGSPPHVIKRLCATVILFVGVICIVGGFLLGRMARGEVKRTNDIVPLNLTVAAENFYKRAKRIPPKAIHHNGPDLITNKLLDIFHCTATECGTATINNLSDFVKRTLHYEVNKLIKTINNASAYLDSLR